MEDVPSPPNMVERAVGLDQYLFSLWRHGYEATVVDDKKQQRFVDIIALCIAMDLRRLFASSDVI